MAVRKKKTTKRVLSKRSRKKTTKVNFNRLKWFLFFAVFFGLGIWFGIAFKDGIKYMFSQTRRHSDQKNVFDVRNVEVLHRHKGLVFGIDVSHYQEDIKWDKVNLINNEFPLEYVFMRATMGEDGYDIGFKKNWRSARANNFIRGAYHYYRPNENSVKQAENFIRNVKLETGDFPPVLDIEEIPKKQSMDSLIVGLKRWINIVEKHYKVKPILYTGEHYYNNHLKKEFPNHIIWIANYNFFVENIKPEWHFWQFTERGMVPGIKSNVDVNIYNGDRMDMRKILIQ